MWNVVQSHMICEAVAIAGHCAAGKARERDGGLLKGLPFIVRAASACAGGIAANESGRLAPVDRKDSLFISF